MKSNAVESLLKTQAQTGVAHKKISPINSMGKNKDSDVKAIGVIINEDGRLPLNRSTSTISRELRRPSIFTWGIWARQTQSMALNRKKRGYP